MDALFKVQSSVVQCYRKLVEESFYLIYDLHFFFCNSKIKQMCCPKICILHSLLPKPVSILNYAIIQRTLHKLQPTSVPFIRSRYDNRTVLTVKTKTIWRKEKCHYNDLSPKSLFYLMEK